MPEARPDIERRLARTLARLAVRRGRAAGASERFVRARTAVFAAGVAMALVAERSGQTVLGWAVLALFGLAFAVLAVRHGRLKRGLARLDRWIGLKREQLARRRLEWDGLPPPAAYPVSEHHPYARDLDIVGTYSLLRLIDTTVSTHGRRALAAALLDGDPGPDPLAARQRLVRELASRGLLRDRLVLAGRAAGGALDGDAILAAVAPPLSDHARGIRRLLAVSAALAAATFAFLVAEYGFGLPRYWSYTFLAYVLIYFLSSGRVAPVFGRALDLAGSLAGFAQVAREIERRREPGAPALRAAAAAFFDPGARPSDHLRRMGRVASALSVKAHPLVHLAVNALGPWDLYFADRYERLRAATAAALPGWLEALGRIEAAAALAGFAWLHPEYAFPEMHDKPALAARTLGHPLIPAARRVANDVRLDGLGSVALLTGSNMSGKSTFLRTIGVNICLALAGAPVCAARLTGPRVRLFCSVRIEDRLEEGLSYFYAEVKRLRQILDATAARDASPVLFLIDEIFKGTNNRERVIGSRYLLAALTEGNGFGLVSTHDLELTALAASHPKIANHHFQETVQEGRLSFDYRLRPGPCPTTNALRIMALEGLPVPRPEP